MRGFLPLLHPYDGALTDEAGKWIIESCPTASTLGFHETDYQTEQVVPQNATSAPDPPGMLREGLLAGEVGLHYDGLRVYGGWTSDNMEATATEIGLALFPRADDRTTFAIGGVGHSWYFNARSANKKLAREFVNTANSRESHVRFYSLDPHIAPRSDAVHPIFLENYFFKAMVDTAAVLVTAAAGDVYVVLVLLVFLALRRLMIRGLVDATPV